MEMWKVYKEFKIHVNPHWHLHLSESATIPVSEGEYNVRMSSDVCGFEMRKDENFISSYPLYVHKGIVHPQLLEHWSAKQIFLAHSSGLYNMGGVGYHPGHPNLRLPNGSYLDKKKCLFLGVKSDSATSVKLREIIAQELYSVHTEETDIFIGYLITVGIGGFSAYLNFPAGKDQVAVTIPDGDQGTEFIALLGKKEHLVQYELERLDGRVDYRDLEWFHRHSKRYWKPIVPKYTKIITGSKAEHFSLESGNYIIQACQSYRKAKGSQLFEKAQFCSKFGEDNLGRRYKFPDRFFKLKKICTVNRSEMEHYKNVLISLPEGGIAKVWDGNLIITSKQSTETHDRFAWNWNVFRMYTNLNSVEDGYHWKGDMSEYDNDPSKTISKLEHAMKKSHENYFSLPPKEPCCSDCDSSDLHFRCQSGNTGIHLDQREVAKIQDITGTNIAMLSTSKDHSHNSKKNSKAIDILQSFRDEHFSNEFIITALIQCEHSSFENALFTVLKSGNVDCAQQLLTCVDIKLLNVDEAISIPAESGNLDMFIAVKSIIPDEIFSTLSVGKTGVKWLHYACIGDCTSIVETLLKAGANPNKCYVKDYIRKGNIPLATCKSAEVAEMLIDFGANCDININANDQLIKKGRHVEGQLIDDAIDCYAVVEVLLKRGAKPCVNFLTGKFKKSHWPPNIDNSMQCSKLINLFLSYGVSPNELDVNGYSLLAMAAEKDDIESVKSLICKGADVNLMLPNGPAIFHTKDPSILQYLIDSGADVNIVNSDGYTAIMNVAESDDGEAIRILIKAGANKDFQNLDGQTPLMIAQECDNIEGFSSLLSAGANVHIKRNKKTLLSKLFLDNESYIEEVSEYIALLLVNGAQPCYREWYFAVHKCIAYGEHSVLSALIHHGGFSPVLYEKSSKKFRLRFTKSFKGILSPLCMALLCRELKIAQGMLNAWYLTVSDLTLLPKSSCVRGWLNGDDEWKKDKDVLNLFDQMSTSPHSLKKLSFVHVSDSLGSHPGRAVRVQHLGLPVKLQKALMFALPDQIIDPKALADISKLRKQSTWSRDFLDSFREVFMSDGDDFDYGFDNYECDEEREYYTVDYASESSDSQDEKPVQHHIQSDSSDDGWDYLRPWKQLGL